MSEFKKGERAERAAIEIMELLNASGLDQHEYIAAIIQALMMKHAWDAGTYSDFLARCNATGPVINQYAASNKRAWVNAVNATKSPASQEPI